MDKALLGGRLEVALLVPVDIHGTGITQGGRFVANEGVPVESQRVIDVVQLVRLGIGS